ncbi:MAG: hypothetical protein K5864_03595 [Bacteroidales bacterium]|nr:hypothetical protein [Bacteroidales bacterium]
MTTTGVTYNHKNSQFWQLDFTGKERDPETGYSYFDARYLESKRMTSFLSVDQYADRYPNRSPYVYCAWNPIKLIDPSGDTIILSKEAWVVQKEAFLSEFDRKEENIPFSYDEETMKMYYTEKNSGYSYSETQNEIIDHYKTLCENNYIVMVHVFDNNEVIKTTERTTTLGQEFAHGMTVHHSNNTADVYISKRPLLKKDGVVKNHPQTEAHQSIAILHEIGGHAFYHSQNVHGRENDRLTSEFENRCRDIFRGKYCFATKEIRQGRSSEIH